MAVDESGRRSRSASTGTGSERVAAALHRDHGHRRRMTSSPGSCPPGSSRWCSSARSARLGATQNPILHIFREREVGFCVRQAGAKLLVVPSTFGGFDFEAMAHGIAAESDGRGPGRRGPHLRPLARPRATRPIALPAPPSNGDEVRWLLLHVGHHRRPQGCAAHRPHHRSGGGGHGRAGSRVTADDRNALAFPFPHIGGITWLFTEPADRLPQHPLPGVRPRRRRPRPRPSRASRSPGRARCSTRCTWPRSEQADTPIFPSGPGLPRRRCAEAAGSCTSR